jgi:putative ABC transport system substrate-binding protein
MTAFRDGLSEAGYIEGRNVEIVYRWAEGRYGRFPALAADLVRRQVSVIATPGVAAAAVAAKAATPSIPIVFCVGEGPVRLGLVASLSRPGGNATGVNFFTTELVAKRLGLLRELLPGVERIAVLVNPTNTTAETIVNEVEVAAHAIGQSIQIVKASTNREIDAAFTKFVSDRVAALLMAPDPFFNSRRVQLATLAARHSIPAVYVAREYAEAGGLMSYGTNLAEMFRQVGTYAGRILKGTKPADLPVLQSITFELVINLATARASKFRRHCSPAPTRSSNDSQAPSRPDPNWLTGERLAQKMAVVTVPVAWSASIRFVTGLLDPLPDSATFQDIAKRAQEPIPVILRCRNAAAFQGRDARAGAGRACQAC